MTSTGYILRNVSVLQNGYNHHHSVYSKGNKDAPLAERYVCARSPSKTL